MEVLINPHYFLKQFFCFFFLALSCSATLAYLNNNSLTDPDDIKIVGLMLYDPKTNQDIQSIPLNQLFILDYGDFAESIPTIRAVTEPETIGSVLFNITSYVSDVSYYKSVDNVSQYFLFGDQNGTVYSGMLRRSDLVITPYSDSDAKGTSGNPVSISIAVNFSLKTNGFKLINTESQMDLGTVNNSQRIYLSDIDNDSISFQYDISYSYIYSMEFSIIEVNGMPIFHGKSRLNTEDFSYPYTIFDELDQKYIGMRLPPGEYLIDCVVNSIDDLKVDTLWEKGSTISRSLLTFKIKESRGLAIEKLMLVDADSDEDLFMISKGMGISASKIPDSYAKLSIKAIPEIDGIGSVKFELKGPESSFKRENHAPYTLFGDENGDIYGKYFTPSVNYPETIPYLLRVTPYSEPYFGGYKGETYELSFTFYAGIPIIEYQLILSDSREILATIIDGLVLDDQEFKDQNLSVISSLSYPYVESTKYELSGPNLYQLQRENQEPYTLFGDNISNGEIEGIKLPVGDYTLKVRYYSEDYWQGHLVTNPTILNFSIRNFSNDVEAGKNNLIVYPVPSNGIINVKYDIRNDEDKIRLMIVNAINNVVYEQNYSDSFDISLDLRKYMNQVLIVKLISGKGVEVSKVLIN